MWVVEMRIEGLSGSDTVESIKRRLSGCSKHVVAVKP